MKTIVICGKKQAGKTSTANAIYGHMLVAEGVINRYQINVKTGELLVPADGDNTTDDGMAYFDIDKQDREFHRFCELSIWPFVRHYPLADSLKEMIHTLFGVDRKMLWGTDKDKEKKTKVNWYAMERAGVKAPRSVKNLRKLLTARELMQYFGSLMRSIDDNCFIRASDTKMKEFKSKISIVPDCRYANEFEYFEKQDNVFKIKLLRSSHKDDHESENGLEDIATDRYDLIIDNNAIPVVEKNEGVIAHLIDHKFLKAI